MPGGAEVTGAELRALRESRGWEPRDLAVELRKASDQPLAKELIRSIWAWETGKHRPTGPNLRAYREVFPELAGADAALPDPDAVLERARRLTGLHIGALTSGDAELAEMADVLLTLQRQVDAAALRLERALAAKRREAGGDAA